jgi:hypothetical protein
MKAAQRRDLCAQARAAEATWTGTHYSHTELLKYVDALTGRDRSLPPEHLVAVLNSATQGLPSYTREEIYRMNEVRHV